MSVEVEQNMNTVENLHQTVTSSFLRAQDKKCMCQVCRCHRPDHRCPAHYMKGNFKNETTFQKDYKPLNTEKPALWHARDNLKFNKLQNHQTEYKEEFIPRVNPKDQKNLDPNRQKWEDMVMENNVRSHIKNLLGNRKDLPQPNYDDRYAPGYGKGYGQGYGQPRSHSQNIIPQNGEQLKGSGPNGTREEPLGNNQRNPYGKDADVYYQPKKWAKPKITKEKLPMNEKTAYQKEFIPQNQNYKKQGKLVHDNLVVGHPDKLKPSTTYQKDYLEKAKQPSDNYPKDKELYQINKDKNTFTNTLPADHPEQKNTEYKRNFKALKQTYDVCPIHKLPVVPSDLKKMPKHIFYDKDHNNWYTK